MKNIASTTTFVPVFTRLKHLSSAVVRNGQELAESSFRLVTNRHLRRMPTKKQDATLLEAAKRHLKAHLSALHQYPTNEHSKWEDCLKAIQQRSLCFKTVQEAILFAQDLKTVGFDHRVCAREVRSILPLYESFLYHEFPHFSDKLPLIEESPYAIAETLFKQNHRFVSNVFFFHLRYVFQCLTWIKKPKHICEIGGGYGAPARLWMKNPIHTPSLYCIIDFPESLFFAEIYLKLEFGENRVLFIDEYLSSTPQPSDVIVLCPIHQIDQLSNVSFELAINTGSLQEMVDEWVTFWMDWIDQANISYFYSLNYFGQPLDQLFESSNCYSPRLPEHWTPILQRIDPPLVHSQTPRHYAEILFKKEEEAVDKSILKSEYERSKRSVFDLQTFLMCVELVRQSNDQAMIRDLIVRCQNSFGYYPKELHYLVSQLKDQTELLSLKKKLDRLLYATEKISIET